jgi:squalene synthase HpnC
MVDPAGVVTEIPQSKRAVCGFGVLYSAPDLMDTMSRAPQAQDSRTAATENFPVGSRLLPRALRPAVAAFYGFARAADDIADNPLLEATAKLEMLDAMDRNLTGDAADTSSAATARAAALRAICLERRLSLDNPRHLLVAFRADAANRPCRAWSDLLAYCRYSATPVGRFLLELHGEDRATYPAADALCSALQILNHIQDCQADFRSLHRVYVPTAWLDEHGLTPRALLAERTSPALRSVLNRLLDGVDQLNETAAALPGSITERGLRMEAAGILGISRRLAAKLRRQDPLAGRVALTRLQTLRAVAAGAARGWRRR